MSIETLDQPKPFVPREKEFWIYNTAGWLGALLIFFAIALSEVDQRLLPWSTVAMYSVIGSVLTYIGGTCAGLVFRSWYHRNRWWQSTYQMVLPRAILLALISGFLFNATANLIYDVISGIPAEYFSDGGELQITAYVIRYAYPSGNGALAFMLVMLWCLIYLGIKGPENSRSISIRALELESSLKEAQLNALSGQIQPHFLFNALNNIRFMIQRDANRAEDSLVALSEILRHSLDSSRNEKVELIRELGIARQYLDLMQNQMGDRLNYSIDLPASLEKALMPPMIIQMLAENAIKHGIERNRQGGRVSIGCEEKEGQLVISVRNTLAEADAGSKTAASVSLEESDSGVGLRNIAKRLTLLYGPGAHLAMSAEGGQALVRIELPMELAI